MASRKLKKYLAYYQKMLREDPENIEARLRLAALFKEIGSTSHAVEEYVTASKLLAAQGLPLEAIAACKAVLQLDGSHTEVQFFLARLYAQAPDALRRGARVAKPLKINALHNSSPSTKPSLVEVAATKLETLSTDELDAFERSGQQPITLARPKPSLAPSPELAPLSWTVEEQTPTVSRSSAVIHDALKPAAAAAHTRVIGSASEATHITRPKRPAPFEFAASKEAIERARALVTEEMRQTVGYRDIDFDLDELRDTQAFDPEELRALSDASVALCALPRAWGVLDATLHQRVSQEVLDALARAAALETAPETKPDREHVERSEAFSYEVGLDHEETETLLDEQSDEAPRPSNTLGVSREDQVHIPLLGRLNQEAFLELLQRARTRELEAGETILKPGHGLKSLYVVLSGEVAASKRVVQNGEPAQVIELARFGQGEFFGEFAFLTGRDQSATVKATERARLLEISEELIHHVAAHDEEIWDTLWRAYHARMLNNMMVSDRIFGLLSDPQRDEILDHFEAVHYAAGEMLLGRDQPCPCVYFMLQGVLQITPASSKLPTKTVREGEFFGFVASLSREPCMATVRALRDSTVLRLSATRFRELIRLNAPMAAEIRALLRSRVHRHDLFLTEMTPQVEAHR